MKEPRPVNLLILEDQCRPHAVDALVIREPDEVGLGALEAWTRWIYLHAADLDLSLVEGPQVHEVPVWCFTTPLTGIGVDTGKRSSQIGTTSRHAEQEPAVGSYSACLVALLAPVP